MNAVPDPTHIDDFWPKISGLRAGFRVAQNNAHRNLYLFFTNKRTIAHLNVQMCFWNIFYE